MAFVQIIRYGFTWSENERRFALGLWTNPRNTGPNPDFEVLGLSPDEVSAFSAMILADKDRRLFFDPSTRKITSGIEQI
jgi:hypothetical protein